LVVGVDNGFSVFGGAHADVLLGRTDWLALIGGCSEVSETAEPGKTR
jgi:hypothetical protein